VPDLRGIDLKTAALETRAFDTALQLKLAAGQWLLQQQRKSQRGVWIVGRTRALASDCVRVTSDLPNAPRGLIGVHRSGFNAFVRRTAQPKLEQNQWTAAGMLSMEATAAAAIQEALRHDALPKWKKIAEMPGFPKAVARTIGDLRQAALPEDAVEGEIGVLYRLYAQQLRRGGLADTADLIRLATEALLDENDRLQQRNLQNEPEKALAVSLFPILLVDPPTDSVLESRFCQAIADRPGSGHLRLQAFVSTSAQPPEDASLTVLDSLTLARQNLFGNLNQQQNATAAKATDLDRSLAFFSASTESLEAVEIARRITHLVENPVRFDECAVLLRDRGQYETLIGEALDRAGIPAYFSRGVRRPHPAGRALLALLRCAAEDLSSVRFCEYLSIGQARRTGDVAPKLEVAPDDEWLGFEEETSAILVAVATAVSDSREGQRVPRRWERLIQKSGIVGRFETWSRRLTGFEEELQSQIETAEEEQRSWIEQDIEELAQLRAFALPLLELLETRPSESLWSDWLEWLQNLVRSAILDPEPVLAILEELRPMSDVGPVALSEVIRVLQPRLVTAREPQPGTAYGRVFIGTIAEARGRSWKAVFLPGLGEGLFPKRILEDPLLLDAVRQDLTADLPVRSDAMNDERMLLKSSLSCASESFCISYSRTDGSNGRARVPSFYALEVLRAATGSWPELSTWEQEVNQEQTEAASSLWPAPRQAEQAIDGFEFDLARIRQAQQGRVEAGGLRYLLDQNIHLQRSLRAVYRRGRKKIDRNDGAVIPPEKATLWREALRNKHLNARDYSASSLERFGQCPYQFFLSAMVGLRPREIPEAPTHLNRLTRGALFHRVLDGFFKQVRQFGVSEPLALQLMNHIFDSVAKEETDRLQPVNTMLWANELEDIRLDLHGWMKKWLTEREQWKPVDSEVNFEAVDLFGLATVKGRIDLVEQSDTKLRVTDFKTGRPPSYLNPKISSKTAGGRALQPLIYSVAAAKVLKKGAVESARLYYSTQQGGYHEQLFKNDAGGARALENVLQSINKSLAIGLLPADPRGATGYGTTPACDTCDFSKVCGPNAKSLADNKDREMLTEIDRVRCEP
jgi:ATP-dependent helicase/nuclease subunit B